MKNYNELVQELSNVKTAALQSIRTIMVEKPDILFNDDDVFEDKHGNEIKGIEECLVLFSNDGEDKTGFIDELEIEDAVYLLAVLEKYDLVSNIEHWLLKDIFPWHTGDFAIAFRRFLEK